MYTDISGICRFVTRACCYSAANKENCTTTVTYDHLFKLVAKNVDSCSSSTSTRAVPSTPRRFWGEVTVRLSETKMECVDSASWYVSTSDWFEGDWSNGKCSYAHSSKVQWPCALLWLVEPRPQRTQNAIYKYPQHVQMQRNSKLNGNHLFVEVWK